MPYSDLPLVEQILLAAECVGRGINIPREIRDQLGPEIIRDIENPETSHDRHQEC